MYEMGSGEKPVLCGLSMLDLHQMYSFCPPFLFSSQGNMCLTLNRPEAAVRAFRKAQLLKPDLQSYQGLVRSCLAIPKHKEALYAAREAVKAMPQSAKALTLVGDVYTQHPDGHHKARRFYKSALRLEPMYLGAVLALAELYGIESRNEEATLLLQRYLKTRADDALRLGCGYYCSWQVRIKAEVQVIELDESCLAPYTFDYTRAFAEEVAMYRKTNKHRSTSPETSRQRGEIPKLGEKLHKEKALSTFQLSELEGGGHSRQHRRSSSSPNGLRTAHSDEATHWKTRSDDSLEFEVATASVSPSISSEYKKKKPMKITQWADGSGETTSRGELQNPLEIEFDKGHQELDTLDSDEDDELDNDSAVQSSSQFYPGSPTGNPLAHEAVPEPLRRTWETISQSYSPKKLNDIILEQSRDASLILINLPDHYQGIQPNRYMEYCEELCDGLGRVLLVHGTGKELYGGQAHLGLINPANDAAKKELERLEKQMKGVDPDAIEPIIIGH